MKSLYEAMLDPDLFGGTFAGPTFDAWRTVAKILDGLPLTETELALYGQITGRADAPSKPFSEAYLIKPRRAGGTLFAAAVGLHAALGDHKAKLGPGEMATVAMIASDRRQARQLLNYVKGLIDESPMISAEVTNITTETIAFQHRVQLEVHTTSFRSTRGYSYAAVILDELAFFRDDLSANPDVELVRAVRPGLSNLGGRLLGLSSPHSRRGHLFDMWRQHYGQPSPVLVLAASHSILNPTIDPAIIARAMEEDPVAARSEWFGEFRSDVSQYLPDDLIDGATVTGRLELPITNRHAYSAFCDPSGGASDAMTMAIAHVEPGTRTENVVLDQIHVAAAPFEPDEVVRRFAAVMQRFGIRHVTGDRYAAEWVVSAFKKYQVRYETSDLDKSAIYAEVLPLFTQKRVELLDDRRLLTELRLLERKPRSGGRGDAIDHPPRAHDDIANAVCGALWQASISKKLPLGHRGGLSRPAYCITE
jgi:hypothetical protein